MKVNTPAKLSAHLFADRLKRIRTIKGLTQSTLGDAIGMPQAGIARLESGRIDPKFSTLLKLSQALGCGLADFAT